MLSLHEEKKAETLFELDGLTQSILALRKNDEITEGDINNFLLIFISNYMSNKFEGYFESTINNTFSNILGGLYVERRE